MLDIFGQVNVVLCCMGLARNIIRMNDKKRTKKNTTKRRMWLYGIGDKSLQTFFFSSFFSFLHILQFNKRSTGAPEAVK
jgi:hypothetical protein